jgi:lipopolysaccharide exporter
MGSLAERISEKFAKGRFSHHVAVLGGGTALAQGFALLFAPILTRLYTPDDVGRMGLYLAFASFAGVAASLRYEIAIVSAVDDREAALLTLLSAMLLLPTGIVSAGALYLMIRRSVLGLGSLPTYTVLLLIPALCLTGLFSALRYWFIRKEGFRIISGAVVSQNALRVVSQTCLGWWGLGWLGLFWGDLIGRATGIARMLRDAWPAFRKFVVPLQMKNIWSVSMTYRKFPLYSLASSLIDTLSTTIPLPIIVTLYGTKDAGFFALVQRVLAAPLLLVGTSVADAFHSRTAKYSIGDAHLVPPFFKRTAAALLLVGGGPAVLLAFFGERIFGSIFGSNWTLAGSLAAVMAPWAVAQLVVSPLSRVVFVYQGQEWKLVYDAANLISTLVVFYYGHTHGFSLVRTVRILSWVSVATYGIYFLILLRIVNRGVREYPRV